MTMIAAATTTSFSRHGHRHLLSSPPTTMSILLFSNKQLHNAICCSSRRRTTNAIAAVTSFRFRQLSSIHHWMIVSFSTSTTSKSTSNSSRSSRISGTIANSSSSFFSTTHSIRREDDWREWFRSSDYDDPWSPYYSFSKQDEKATATIANHREKYQKWIVPSVMGIKLDVETDKRKGEETIAPWQRRRHGMNLEPLTLLFRGTNVTGENVLAITTSTSSKDHGSDSKHKEEDSLFQSAQGEAENVEAILIEKAQARMRRMDTQTRFLCRMLDDLYRTGIWRESDRPTVERCHRAISRLLIMTPEDPPRQLDKKNADAKQSDIVSFTGLAQRAGAILQRMELCSPPLRCRLDDVVIPSDQAVSSQQLMIRSSYQGIYPEFSPHLQHTKFALPTPTREIYNMVLISYSKEVGPLHVAQQAEDVVWSMIARARKQQIQITNNELLQNSNFTATASATASATATATATVAATNKRTVILLPSTENWNCVLKCWSKSTDPHRSFYAYSFLQSWIEWSNQYQSLLDNECMTNKEGAEDESKPNLDSFRIVLHSCLVDKSSQDLEIKRAKQQIGSGVAIHLWKEMQKVEIDTTTYKLSVQAICQTSELPTTVSTSKALTALARVYTNCCKDGMLTDEISNLVEAATTKSQFLQLQAMADTTTSTSLT